MKWHWFDKAPPLLLTSSLLDQWQGVEENSDREGSTTYWQILDFLESQSRLTGPCIEIPVQDGKGLIITTPFRFSWLDDAQILAWDEYSYNVENIDNETLEFFKDFKPESLVWSQQLHWQAVQADYALFNSASSPQSESFDTNVIFIKFEPGSYSIDSASVESEHYWFEFLRFRMIAV